MDVEIGVDRSFAAEADHAPVQAEDASGEIIIPLDEVCSAREARRVRKAADLEIGAPPAVDAETGHLQASAGKLQVQLPGMQRGRLDHVFFIEASFANVELRDRRRGACSSKLKTTFVEPEVARDRAAIGIGPDLQRTRHLRSDVVAIEQLGALRVEVQV